MQHTFSENTVIHIYNGANSFKGFCKMDISGIMSLMFDRQGTHTCIPVRVCLHEYISIHTISIHLYTISIQVCSVRRT